MSVLQLSGIILRTACLLALSILALSFSQVYAGILKCEEHKIRFIDLPDAVCPMCNFQKLSEDEIAESVASWNGASLRLFQKSVGRIEKNRVVVSHSVQNMLSMLVAGSNSKTQKRLAKRMGAKPETLTSLLNLQRVECTSKHGKFSRHNLIVLGNGYKFRNRYKKYLRNHADDHADENLYRSTPIDFTNQKSIEDLTDYTSDLADKIFEGKITGYLDSAELLQKKPSLALFNVTYFSYPWMDNYKIKRAAFFLQNGRAMLTTMFTGELSTIYIEHDGWKSITIPYDNEDFEMVAILPPKGSQPKDISPEQFYYLYNKPAHQASKRINISIPEHNFSSTYELANALSTHKKGNPFAQGADLTSMVKTGSLWINSIIHKAMIKTNRLGSTRSPVTAAVMANDTAPAITFNRPHLIVIRDKKNLAMRIIGQVYYPKKAKSFRYRRMSSLWMI